MCVILYKGEMSQTHRNISVFWFCFEYVLLYLIHKFRLHIGIYIFVFFSSELLIAPYIFKYFPDIICILKDSYHWICRYSLESLTVQNNLYIYNIKFCLWTDIGRNVLEFIWIPLRRNLLHQVCSYCMIMKLKCIILNCTVKKSNIFRI